MLKITLSLILTLFLILFCTLFTGELKAQFLIDYIPNNTPDYRYTLHGDGTVTDTATGLQWQRCSLGKSWNGDTCTGDATEFTWLTALQQGEDNRFADYSDWRLPNIKELYTLVAYDRNYPAINLTVFPNTDSSSVYWSSSTNHYNSRVWDLSASGGWVFNQSEVTDYNEVRLVRGGN